MLAKQKLGNLYESGLSMKKIADEMEESYYTVKYWMEKHNIPRRPKSEACYYAYWGIDRRLSKSTIRRPTVEEVKDLYYGKGYSAREVGEFFERSKSSIYKFMRKHGLPRRSPSETNEIAFNRQPPSFVLKKNLNRDEEKLKIAGIMLYWGEGDKNLTKMAKKRGATVDLGNSDPKIIKLFLKFLGTICGVDEKRLRVGLYCYADQDVEALKRYWHKITGIPLTQFQKPYIRKDFSSEKSGRMKYGLAHIKYSDKKLFLQIQDWTNQYLKGVLQK